MSSEGMVHISPSGGNAAAWAKGLWTLGGSVVSAVVGHRTGIQPTHVEERGCGQTTEEGVYANQRFSLSEDGQAYGGKAKVSNRTREIRPSGIIGGPPETWPWWK
jgi:hypothetical protein